METMTCASLKYSSLETVPMTAIEFEEISDIQQKVLQMVADGGSHETILMSLCKLSESLLANSVASIMIKDEKNRSNECPFCPYYSC